MTARRRRRAARDQAESTFNIILEELLALVPYARAAALVDFEGETVDYAGDLDPYELRVAAATLQLVFADIRPLAQLGSAHQLNACMGRAGYLLRILDPSYSLLVVLRKLGTFVVSQRLLLEIEARILEEAGLPIVRKPSSFRVDVDTAGSGAKARPARVRPPFDPFAEAEPPWVPLEVLGSHVGTAPGEKAYRVRLATGAELNLLRDATKLWFSEEPIQALLGAPAATRPAV